MNATINCKSCGETISNSVDICPTCNVKSPLKMSAKKKRTLLSSLVVGIVIVVIVPMVAALLWMQSK